MSEEPDNDEGANEGPYTAEDFPDHEDAEDLAYEANLS